MYTYPCHVIHAVSIYVINICCKICRPMYSCTMDTLEFCRFRWLLLLHSLLIILTFVYLQLTKNAGFVFCWIYYFVFHTLGNNTLNDWCSLHSETAQCTHTRATTSQCIVFHLFSVWMLCAMNREGVGAKRAMVGTMCIQTSHHTLYGEYLKCEGPWRIYFRWKLSSPFVQWTFYDFKYKCSGTQTHTSKAFSVNNQFFLQIQRMAYKSKSQSVVGWVCVWCTLTNLHSNPTQTLLNDANSSNTTTTEHLY